MEIKAKAEEGSFKSEVVKLLNAEFEKLGNWQSVAKKCEVSYRTIFAMRKGELNRVKLENWNAVAAKLGYKMSDWQFVETTNFQRINRICDQARKEAMWIAISDVAGSGKSIALKNIAEQKRFTYLLRCREWAKMDFITNLTTSLGISKNRNWYKPEDSIREIIRFFQERHRESPQLIIDEADKLKDSGLRFLITLYNETEDFLSVVMVGTENLKKEIKRGVRLHKKGYDEIDSRFGRNFIPLIGSNKKDVTAICQANGIDNPEVITKIFDEAQPTTKMVSTVDGGQRPVRVIEDLRRVKRIIKRIKIQNEQQQQ